MLTRINIKERMVLGQMWQPDKRNKNPKNEVYKNVCKKQEIDPIEFYG